MKNPHAFLRSALFAHLRRLPYVQAAQSRQKSIVIKSPVLKQIAASALATVAFASVGTGLKATLTQVRSTTVPLTATATQPASIGVGQAERNGTDTTRNFPPSRCVLMMDSPLIWKWLKLSMSAH